MKRYTLAHEHTHTHTQETLTVPKKQQHALSLSLSHTHTHTHACSTFKVIKRGDFKCSYLFGACCRGNRQRDCAGSLEFLSSCGVRPPCVPLPIFPDPTHLHGAEVGRGVGRGGGGGGGTQGLEVKHSRLHCKYTETRFGCKYTVGWKKKVHTATHTNTKKKKVLGKST